MAKVVHLFLLSVIFAILAVTTNYRGMYKMDHMSECSRFCAVVIWDINTDDTDIRFIYHKRFLYALISKMPEGSYIILKTTDDLNTELIFKKDFRWTEQLHGIKFSFSNNKAAIPHSLLQKTVETSLDWNETADMDIQLFLLLNDISHFDDEKKAGEALTIVNTFVVFTGKIQPQSVFTDLASDEQHVYGPITGGTNDNVFRYETDHFLDLSCQNSRSNCGASMYLNRSKCYKCGYICGRTKNTSPQFCLSTCSNLYQSTSTLSLVDMSENNHNSCTDLLLYQVAIVVLVFVTAILVLLLLCVTCKYCKAVNEERKEQVQFKGSWLYLDDTGRNPDENE